MRRSILALVLFLPVVALAQPAPPAVPVGVVTASRQPVTQGTELVGRVEAIDRVEIRARITGYLQSVDFTEGAIVHEGDRLYQIEPEPFIAAQLEARGALLQAQSQAPPTPPCNWPAPRSW